MSTSKICDKFESRVMGLFEKPAFYQGPCRFHQGGTVCTRKEVFRCETQGFKVEPRADQESDGEID